MRFKITALCYYIIAAQASLTLGTLHGCDASLTLLDGTHSGGQSPKVDGPAPPHYVTRTTSHTASQPDTRRRGQDAAPRTASEPQQLPESCRRTQRLLLSGVSRVLCHWSTSGGRKGVVRRRTVAAHTSLLARGLTPAPITMTHPPVSRRLAHRNFFLDKISLRLGTDPHAPHVMPGTPEAACCPLGEDGGQTRLAGTKQSPPQCLGSGP